MSDNEDTKRTDAAGDGAPADETFGWTEENAEAESSGGPAQAARDIIEQIQTAVDAIAEKAGPVVRELQAKAAPVARELAERAAPVAREVGARAAGLMARAGDKAGPIAHKAAEMTADAGVKLAEKSREKATELRHAVGPTDRSDGAGSTEAAPADDTDGSDDKA